MKVKVDKTELREAIGKINKIIRKDTPLVSSKLICLDVQSNQIFLSGVQPAISMRTSIKDVVMDASFSCLFDGNMVMALLAKVTSKDVILSFDEQKETLQIKDETHMSVKLRCEDCSQFPGFKELESPDFEKRTDVLFPYVAACKHVLPTKYTNRIMSSFCVQYGDGNWRITATNGSCVSSRGAISCVENTVLVPGDIMTTLEGIFQNCNVTLSIKEKDIWIRDEKTEVFLKTVSGNFFNLDSVVNAPSKFKATINRANLENALSLASVSLLNEQQKLGTFLFGKEGLEISTSDRLGNEMKNNISYTGYVDSPLLLGVNVKYILDAVKSIPDDVISLELISELHPIKISGENYLEIVLPVKLRA